MPGPYPTSYDSLIVPTDGVTNVDQVWGDPITYAVSNLQTFLGLAGDAPSSTGTLSAKVGYLIANAAHVTFGASTAFPGSPTLNDIFITNDTTPWTPYVFQGGGVWKVLGGDAVSLLGIPILPGTPSNNQVLKYNSTDAKWEIGSATGFADPLSSPWTLYTHDAANTPFQIPAGSVGQVPTVQVNGSLAFEAPPYMPLPSGAAEGSVPIFHQGAWTHAVPGSSGYVWTSNGPGAEPTFQAVPTTPPGSGIAAPAGLRVGSLIQYDGSTFITVLPGPAGTYLTAHGDNNNVGSLLTWTTIAGMVNPMSAPGDTIVGGSSGTPGRIAIGTAGQFYRVSSGAPAWQGLDGGKTGTYIEYAEQASNPSAIASSGLLFSKTDHHLYFMESGGTLHDLLAAGTGYNTVQHNNVPLTARTITNFIDGVGMRIDIADNVAQTRTDVTIRARWSRALAFV